MSFEPFNWNVIVVGAWNRAILTPEWIGRYLFQAASGTPVAVEVPLNVPGPWRVCHDTIAVLVGQGTLEIATNTCTDEVLDRARNCAKLAMDELPRTPLVAAGFNIRYRSNEAPPELASVLACQLDDIISGKELVIGQRRLHRSLSFNEGALNLELAVHPDEGTSVQFNFHKGSAQVGELRSWLSLPISDVRGIVETIMDSLPGVVYERNQ